MDQSAGLFGIRTSRLWNKGPIKLVAGQSYDIKMEYFQNAGAAVAKLLWSSPSTPKQVIPTSQLYAGAAWLSSDIGSPAKPGITAVSGSVYSIQGSGAGV